MTARHWEMLEALLKTKAQVMVQLQQQEDKIKMVSYLRHTMGG